VGTTNLQGAFEATRHLLRLGRQRIAIITGPGDVGRHRLAGYRQALQGAGAPFHKELVVAGDFCTPSGVAAATELVRSGVPFDAVFSSNDEMAFGALRALREAGLRVPEDVALVGFDDVETASHTTPALTTVRQPLAEMGAAAARAAIAAAEGRPIEQHVEIPTSLVVRDSCGAGLRAEGAM
jgi:LacI family transcriptional regulator